MVKHRHGPSCAMTDELRAELLHSLPVPRVTVTTVGYTVVHDDKSYVQFVHVAELRPGEQPRFNTILGVHLSYTLSWDQVTSTWLTQLLTGV